MFGVTFVLLVFAMASSGLPQLILAGLTFGVGLHALCSWQ